MMTETEHNGRRYLIEVELDGSRAISELRPDGSTRPAFTMPPGPKNHVQPAIAAYRAGYIAGLEQGRKQTVQRVIRCLGPIDHHENE